ncbi:MAG TPA: tetratricopeptide repeat protein [Sedimenticola sp.]|nr:tetratricopeptide repeat protein [Sedimenticola sp.]
MRELIELAVRKREGVPVLPTNWLSVQVGSRLFQYAVLALGLLLLSACATNPVTGEDELTLVSEAQELAIGREQYAPSRQMQGGDYQLDPELSRYVNQVGQRLAAVSDRKLPYEFVVVNDSTPNAWALPGGKIAVNRGLLLELESEAELAAVLGHEIVHAAARHGAKGMERGILLQGAVIAAGMASGNNDYSRLAVGAAALGANLLNQRYSREAELEADHYGMLYMARAGYDPQAAVKLQETFVRLSKERKRNWLSGLFASHPPSDERVRRNRETAGRLGAKGGDWGTERFRQKTAALRRTRPAYEALAEGLKALKEGDEQRALDLADKAIRIEPKEALFYSLRGDVYFKQKRYRDALEEYARALKHNGDYFRFYLERGLTLEKLGRRKGARRDLKKSAELLPTAVAYNALGRLALESGNKGQAKKYFSRAAGSRSPEGIAAAKELMRLDMPDNPNRYFRARLELYNKGQVIAVVQNRSDLPVRNVRIGVGRRAGGGRLHDVRRERIWGLIRPGETARIRVDVEPLADKKQLRRYGVIVLGAEIAE